MPGFNDVPFNFVPLNHEVFIPEWGYKISQDVPFEDGEDGIISFEITNTTPLFIKNGIGESGEDTMSASIVDAEGHRHYYIPATSLKGMLRSVLEILSFSKMQPYDNSSFGYRSFDGGVSVLDAANYVEKMEEVFCGWLRLRKSDGHYEIENCGKPTEIEMDKLPRYYHKVERKNAVDKYKEFRKLRLGNYPKLAEFDQKFLVCSGYMNNKKYEHLFPSHDQAIERLTVEETIINSFKSVYEPSPYYDFIVDMLRKRERLAVFFTKSDDKVNAVGITRMFRYPYNHCVEDGVNQNPTKGLDLSECIFGYTNHTKSLRGRVQFGNAFPNPLDRSVEKLQDPPKGILGQPKASYYPYYLSSHNTYNSDDIEIAGRKRYRVHAQDNITELPKGNDNPDNNMQPKTLNLLAAGNRFECKIKVHNLRPVEIGALLSAITFHMHSKCHHNIGMAKAMGYGRLDIQAIQLESLKYDAMYYMFQFEKQMMCFKEGWVESEQVKRLLQIATDHTNHLEYMDFNGYKEGKRNVDELTEEGRQNSITPQSIQAKNEIIQAKKEQISQCLTEKDYKKVLMLCDELEQALLPFVDKAIDDNYRTQARQMYENQLAEKKEWISQCLTEGDYEKVLTLCDELEQSLLHNEDASFIEDYRKKAQTMKSEHEEQEASMREAEEKRRRIESGLGAFLNEKNLYGEYKVKDFKVAIKKTAKYLTDKRTVTGEESLSEEELLGLQRSLLRIYKSITKQRDQKEWTNPDSGKWCELAKLVGDSEKNKIYEKIMV